METGARQTVWCMYWAAICGAVVFPTVGFFGAGLLTMALRDLMDANARRFIGPSGDGIGRFASTYIVLAIVTPSLGAVAGLLAAAVSRRAGVWRLITPLVGFGYWTWQVLRVSSRLMEHPSVRPEARHAVEAVQAGYSFYAMALLLSIVPALIGVWLGMKLWPWPPPAHATDQAEDAG